MIGDIRQGVNGKSFGTAFATITGAILPRRSGESIIAFRRGASHSCHNCNARLTFVFAFDARFWSFLKASALPWLTVIVLLLLGIAILSWVRKRYRDHEDRAADMERMLLQFRDLKREGDLSDEEYRSIKNRLVEQIGKPSRDKSPETAKAIEDTAAPPAQRNGDGQQDGPDVT